MVLSLSLVSGTTVFQPALGHRNLFFTLHIATYLVGNA